MDNHFNSKGGDQNIAQGKEAIGKQENVTQEVRGDGCISSGTGNVTVNQGLSLKPKTVVIASVLAAAVLGASLAGWHWLAPKPPVQTNSIVIKDNKQSGPTAIAQGTGAAVTQTNNYSGGYNVSLELFEKYVKDLNVTYVALVSFFKIMEEQKVPRADLDSKLREIAAQYKELLVRLDSVQSEDPQVVKLKKEAKQAIEAGDYAKAEELLNQAEALDMKAIEQMEKTTKQRRISAAATNADQARLQRIQLRYAKAAEYWQKAAALLTEDQKQERALYLLNAGYDFYRVAEYKAALPLSEQSLAIMQEIGDKAGEGTTLSNIGALHHAKGDYTTALKYLEQSLRIRQEIGDRAGEGATLNNISQIYDAWGDYENALNYLEESLHVKQMLGDKIGEDSTLNNISAIYWAWGDYDTALKYLEQSLTIARETSDKEVEGAILNNIGSIHLVRRDYSTALKYLEQSLRIRQELGDKAGETMTNWNIGRMHENQGYLSKAEAYMSRAVQLAEEIGHPKLGECRKGLEALRAKLRGK